MQKLNKSVFINLDAKRFYYPIIIVLSFVLLNMHIIKNKKEIDK